MREIKFRAWDGELMVEPSMNMVITSYSGMPMWSFAYEPLMPQPDWILMQSTGLNDRNGKEIYEGDILKLDDVAVPVTWMDGSFHIITSESQGGSPLIQERAKRFFVVGNIYENPELLEK